MEHWKLTNTKFKELLADAIGQRVWNARETYGIKFELGKEIEKGRGEFHFWVFSAHWWLQKGKGKEFEDIVNSESSEDKIEDKVKVLNGKKLISVEFHEDSFGVVLDFDDDFFIRISPYGKGKKDSPQLQIHRNKKALIVQADGNYFVEEHIDK